MGDRFVSLLLFLRWVAFKLAGGGIWAGGGGGALGMLVPLKTIKVGLFVHN